MNLQEIQSCKYFYLSSLEPMNTRRTAKGARVVGTAAAVGRAIAGGPIARRCGVAGAVLWQRNDITTSGCAAVTRMTTSLTHVPPGEILPGEILKAHNFMLHATESKEAGL